MRLIAVMASCVLIGMGGAAYAAGFRHHGHHVAAVHRGRGVAPAAPNNHFGRGSLGSEPDNPYANYDGPGSAVLNATVRAAREPGVTLELAPDAKETATGGPVGGPPGYDGS